MKKLLILLLSLFFLISPSVFAENLVYHCNIDTYFKNTGDNKWNNKYIKYTFTINNNSISVYDHEIDSTYSGTLSIYSQNPELIGINQTSRYFETLVIDKDNSVATYSTSYVDGNVHGQYGIGKCKLQ